MTVHSGERPGAFHFRPAESKAEAVARLYAISGELPEPLGPGSTERKSVLTGLARRFAVPVNDRMAKPSMAAAIAETLGASWPASASSSGSTITLHGLNILLESASMLLADRADLSELERAVFAYVEVNGFQPARGKLEAVNRISALTGSGPESLGPGSKERKSVLVNLARGLRLDVDLALSKPELGGAIASQLGMMWPRNAWSAGHTITLDGLNILLAGAERRLGMTGTSLAQKFRDARTEAEACLAALADVLEDYWDGRTCVSRMREAEFTHWRQTEWFGWYFEFVGIPALINTFGGGPVEVLNTAFDYRLRSTWDLKAHSTGRGEAVLNDIDAVRQVLHGGGGLGFFVLGGEANFDGEPAFDAWHRRIRGAHPGSEGRRRLKVGFTPEELEAFHVADLDSLDSALLAGALGVMRQGKQPSGAPRKPKYQVRLRTARTFPGFRVARHRLTRS